MAKDKKSFLLYADQQSVFKQLPDEIAGQLIKHIFSYVNDENPTTDNLIINIAFEPIKLQLKRDLQKYESIRERNSANARMRWDAVASSGIPKDTKNADNDTDTDNDNDNVSDNHNDNDNLKETFNELWDLYDKKVSKEASFKAFKNVPKKAYDDIRKNIPLFIKQFSDKQFQPHFSTYLNGKRWQDELKAEVKPFKMHNVATLNDD